MSTYTIKETKEKVVLDNSTFKKQGGEGQVHIIGDTVYKICFPDRMIPLKKFDELRVLDHKRIIQPQNIILDNSKKPVGYTMKAVPGNPSTLARILTRSFREREGVQPQTMVELVKQLVEGLKFIHAHPGYFQVDGNELNYMITDKFDELFFIDVNSFQTPSFPADAIMASIRDWTVQIDPATGTFAWSKLSDSFSAAIMTWMMFTAIHPYKEDHPDFNNRKTYWLDQMKAGVSILDPKSTYPEAAVYHPFHDFIPGGKDGAYWKWYEAIFLRNERLPIPDSFQAVIGPITFKVKEIMGTNLFKINELAEYAGVVTGMYFSPMVSPTNEVVVTSEFIYVRGKQYAKPHDRFEVGFTPKANLPFAVWIKDDKVQLWNIEAGTPIGPFDVSGRAVFSYGGSVYIHCDKSIFEIQFLERDSTIVPSVRVAANVLPQATVTFQGVLFQNVFDSVLCSLFPKPGHHQQIPKPIKELAGRQIVDAKYENNVLMVVTMNGEDGEYQRFVFRFSTDWSRYDVRVVDNIRPTGINFTVLPKGTVICITELEDVEIFGNRIDSTTVNHIHEPAIKTNMKLYHANDEVRLAIGHKVFKFTMASK